MRTTILLCFISTIAISIHSQNIETLQLVEASRLAYYTEQNIGTTKSLSKYNVLSAKYNKKSGFGAASYFNVHTCDLIIAYRGTSNLKDIIADIGIGSIAIFHNPTTSSSQTITKILLETSATEKQPELARAIQVVALIIAEKAKGKSPKLIIEEVAKIDPQFAQELEDSDFMAKKKPKWRYNLIGARWNKLQEKMQKSIYKLTQNLEEADLFYQDATNRAQKQCQKKIKVRITGHSLGGGYAQIIAAKYSIPATTFAAPGMQEARKTLSTTNVSQTYTNIVNYAHQNDIVAKIGKHIGKSIFYPDPPKSRQQREKQLERERKFAAKLPDKVAKKIRKDLRKNWKTLPFAVNRKIRRLQTQYQKTDENSVWTRKRLNKQIIALQKIKKSLDANEQLREIKPSQRMSFLRKNAMLNQYNRMLIYKYQMREKQIEILDCHDIDNYVKTVERLNKEPKKSS